MMKRLSAVIRTRAILFVLIVIAVVIGNLPSHWLLRNQMANMSAEIHAAEQKLLTKLEKLEKDNQYQRKHIEQAQRERAQLQRSIEYHQGLMDRARTLASPSAEPAP